MVEAGVHIIAEMACSHEGEPDLARFIIDSAGEAGADSIQMQIWTADAMVVPQHPDFNLVKGIELTRDQWRSLASHVRSRWPRMQIIACVYERGSVDFCAELGVDAFKLHSADLSNPTLIRHVAQTGKRIDLSVGASTTGEIQSAIEWIRDASESAIWLMYGYQLFPTPTEAIHLRHMMALASLFDLPVGYQDHSDAESEAAFWLPAASLGMGVDILEKHITHDRSKRGIDHQAALNPDEFKRFVEMARQIEAAMGTASPRPFSPEELRYRKYAKKSLVATRDLPADHILREDDLAFMRAEDLGLPPDQIHLLLGRKLLCAIPAYHLIRVEDVS